MSTALSTETLTTQFSRRIPGELGHSNPVKPRSFISSVSPHSSTAHSVKWIRLIVLR